MATAAGSEVVSGLRAPSVELDAAAGVELVQTGRMLADALGDDSKVQYLMVHLP